MASSRLSALYPVLRLRCTVPLLARLRRTNGARVAELVHDLYTPRVTVKQTLNHAVEQGWVRPNPGHGHPLRPEYVLTARGARLGDAAIAVVEAAGGDLEVLLRRWSMPVLLALGGGPRRFNELARALNPVTDRALVLALGELQEAGLIRREAGEGGEVRYVRLAGAARLGPALGAFLEAAEGVGKRPRSGAAASRGYPGRADKVRQNAGSA